MLLAAITLLAPLSAAAQAYPTRPIKIVNGFAAGGSSDIVARLMAQKISEDFGQPVIVEPKPGAGGVLANEYVAKATPDGYTLLIITGAYPVQAALLKKLPFDPIKDLAWISSFTFYPFVVNVGAGSRFKNIEELIAYADRIRASSTTPRTGSAPYITLPPNSSTSWPAWI